MTPTAQNVGAEPDHGANRSGMPAKSISAAPVLSVSGLTTELRVEGGRIRDVDDVSFDLFAGETLGIVGESGCGKSMTALSIMGLLPRPIGRIAEGSITLEGVGDLARMSDEKMKAVRGDQVSMIFQEPMTSLNPVFTIGFQLCEGIQAHRPVSRQAARCSNLSVFRFRNCASTATRTSSPGECGNA